MVTKKLPLVSVIVTTKNEEKNIKNCLESIKYQTYPQEKIEIIVVDNHSTDKTKTIVKKFNCHSGLDPESSIKVKLFDKGPERSAQRNYGIKMAKGNYVMYLDADMILSSTVIERAVKKLEKENLSALYIPEIVLGNSYWSQVRRLERSFYDGTVIDCVRFIRKDVFGKTGGFDLSMTGPEDWDLDKKIRKISKVGLLNKYNYSGMNRKLQKINYRRLDLVKRLGSLSNLGLIYHDEAEFNVKNYLRKKKYYGKSFKNYIQNWGKNDLNIKKQFGLWYRVFGVFIENRKWKRLLRYPILSIGMLFLRFLVGLQFLKGKLVK